MKQFEDTFKAFESRVENNTTKIGEIQAEHIKLREMIYNNQDELEKMRQEKEEILEKTKKATLSRELYSKRFNY